MNSSPRSMEELLTRFVAWAEARPDVRGAFLVGSYARSERPADESSDLDIAMLATQPERYLANTDWLAEIGTAWLTFLEGNIAGGKERRVLFEGGLDVDFSVFSPQQFQQAVRDIPSVLDVVCRGVRVLVDKDGIAADLPPVVGEKPIPPVPPESDFLAIVNEFWYRAVWTAKKLRRGELYVAKGYCDVSMKRLLREMIERHARATYGWEHDTWHDGRFLEQWADPRAVADLHDAYAHYDADDLRRALWATMELFRWLATETAPRLGYSYPTAADEYATEWVRSSLHSPL
jgi:aminoglycoside 6-adenylyltransferase